MDERQWLERSGVFLEALQGWYRDLPTLRMKDVALNPARVAVFGVDLVAGLTAEGPLRSPRIAAAIPHVVVLFRRAYELGVRYFLLPQGRSPEAVIGVSAFGPARAAWDPRPSPELQQLPFANLFQVMPKKSIDPAVGTSLDEWVDVHAGVNTYLVVGNCTDLGVQQLALHLRLRANVQGVQRRVIVPLNCVATYDVPVEGAREPDSLPHDAELLQRVFLYYLALNGIEVAGEVL